MKRLIVALVVIVLFLLIFTSCSDDSSSEPGNKAPVITSIVSNPATVELGQTATVTCTASDADVDVLTYSWNNTGGTISGSGSSITWTAPDTVGNYSVTCEVSDGEDSVNDGVNISTFETAIPGAMVSVTGGTFTMTDPSKQTYVTVTVSDFSIGKYEVTQKEWVDLMGSNPASYDPTNNIGVGDNNPVFHIGWFDILVFCNQKSMADSLTPCYSINGSTDPDNWGVRPIYSSDPTFAAWNAVICDWDATGYRMPTEAEWEFAARGGVNWTDDYTYSGSNIIGDVAWYNDNSGSELHIIGTKLPNQLGIYDMTGNLYEYCWDWYAAYTDNATDPTGAPTGDMRIVRGGSWMSIPENCVVNGRYREYPNTNYDYNGFRLVKR
ncbi:MAG: SUMF1/EgtB/PvdO family nonheme iron enzyme [Candidatus Delongbacteria bacterium]|nr:SUMF1/EgtB/PvdO family nonheme iron enzyme [Candidatus Delongbacteria bacterium]